MNEPTIADGYYWAKEKGCDIWEVVEVKTYSFCGQTVLRTGTEVDAEWSDFTFGPRIDEPGKCQLRDACERLLDAVKSEYETGTNADGTPRYCSCGEVIEIAERALGINTPPAAAQTDC